jgi:poly(3-hydroxybutyrate) depolymerase
MKRNPIYKAVMLFYFSIVGTVFVNAQNFEYKSHLNADIATYSMPYRLFIPSGYNANNNYPLVLFLHGAGERGTDNNAHITSSRGAYLWADPSNQAAHPCFVLAPQCPPNAQWVNTNWSSGSYNTTNVAMSKELKMVKDIIETLQTQYNIDPSRLYITGLSMGGYGTWDFILRYPNMFKAAVPICGAGDPSKASLIGTLPLRVFHSSDDPTVPVAGSRDMVNAINALGDNDRGSFYTEYTDQGHFSWTNAYSTPDLPNWLFTVNPITTNCNNTLVSGVSLTPTSISLIINGTSNLNAIISPANACNKAVTWSSSHPDIATVSSGGQVLGKSAGTATITAISVDGGKTATCTVTVSGANTKSEAEEAALSGININNNHTGYSGSGFVAQFNAVGQYAQFSITDAAAGSQNIIIRYANANTQARALSLYVNGTKVGQVSFPTTPNWATWADKICLVTLNEGNNTIKIQVDNGDTGQFNIDFLAYRVSDGSTGTFEILNNDISIYANPDKTALKLVNIKPNSTISVVSIDGKIISKVISKDNYVDFDVSNWAKGVYTFFIDSKTNKIAKKAIVQ